VISTLVGGIPEGVRDGQTGILVPPRDPLALAQAILTFVKNPQLIAEMGISGRRFVQDKFSRREEYRQLAELYRQVIQQYGQLKQ
jgi:glycosyltransferase involved in cell wall biosynthesis